MRSMAGPERPPARRSTNASAPTPPPDRDRPRRSHARPTRHGPPVPGLARPSGSPRGRPPGPGSQPPEDTCERTVPRPASERGRRYRSPRCCRDLCQALSTVAAHQLGPATTRTIGGLEPFGGAAERTENPGIDVIGGWAASRHRVRNLPRGATSHVEGVLGQGGRGIKRRDRCGARDPSPLPPRPGRRSKSRRPPREERCVRRFHAREATGPHASEGRMPSESTTHGVVVSLGHE